MNCVVIPTLKRPEMLALALQAIAVAQTDYMVDVRIYIDVCSDELEEQISWVRDEYYPDALIFRATERPDCPSGCWNILNALKQGYQTQAEYIHLIEEDVRIFPDYFSRHLEAQKLGYFATCGRWRRQYSRDYYTNPGTCFDRDKLKLVVPHINDHYFQDRRGYLDRIFNRMDEASDLDDGLIRRVIKASGESVYNFDEPTCCHQGFRFYGAKDEWRTTGCIEERIRQLRILMKRRLDLEDPRYLNDWEPFKPDFE